MEIINRITFFARGCKDQQAILTLLLINHHWHNSIVGAPGLFDKVVIRSKKSLYTSSYLLSLSRELPLEVIYSIKISSSFSTVYEVSDLIAKHSYHIRRLNLQCHDWRYLIPALEPLTKIAWPIVRQVEVMGFGLTRVTKHLLFESWEMDIFRDWVRNGGVLSSARSEATMSAHSRVIFRGGFTTTQPGQHKSTMQLRFPTHDMALQATNCSKAWRGFADGPTLETLEVSCLFDSLLVPIVKLLSTQPLPSLTTLSIHARYILDPRPSRTTWMNLADICSSVRNLTLPEGEDDILGLLDSDPGVWPALTHLSFIYGPKRLAPLSKVVTSRCRAGTPIQMVELHDWENFWEASELSVLRSLVQVNLIVWYLHH
jgi:hypothetical protein